MSVQLQDLPTKFPLRPLVAAVWVSLSCLGPCATAWAEDAVEPAASGLRFNGFGTVGIVRADNSEGWEFTRDKSQPVEESRTKTLTDTRLGLQVNWQPSPQWDATSQVVLKRLSSGAPAEQYVDWAYLAYRPTPQWTVRLGRTSPDIFLLVDYRNVGFAYPWVRPNTEFYGWLSLDSMDGLDSSYTWLDGAAQWRVKLAYGQSRTAIQAVGDDVPLLDAKGLLTATASREEDGLLFKVSYAQARSSLSGVPALQTLNQGLAAMQALPVPSVAAQAAELQNNVVFTNRFVNYLALGASYEQGPWWLHAEVSKLCGDLINTNGLRAYTSVAYRVGRWTGYTVWARALPGGDPIATPTDWGSTLTPLIGPAGAQQAAMLGAAAAGATNRSRIDQRTNSLGLRWDFDARMAVKLQWDHSKIGQVGSGLWERATPSPAHADVLSATLDFLF